MLAHACRPLNSQRDRGAHEQAPQDWWLTVCETTGEVSADLDRHCYERRRLQIHGLAVSSTSGTLVATDEAGTPLRPAILYDDTRASATAADLGGLWTAAHSLTKALWLRQEEPHVWQKTRHLLHPADWLTGKLTGTFGVSDSSNALKLGFHPETGLWDRLIQDLQFATLVPRVVSPGTPVGLLSDYASEATGLPASIPVLAGATDGMASLLASGASRWGDANSTLGTTIVWKILTQTRAQPHSGVYSHLHPSGAWAVGAASNSGPGAIRRAEGVSNFEADLLARSRLPSDLVCYLLPAMGERFPFFDPSATTFFEREAQDPAESYAAQLQAVAFVERWGYDVLESCGSEARDAVYSTGGAAKSSVLSQLRANILNRRIVRCRYPTSVFGAAVLAAMGVWYGGNSVEAIRSMTNQAQVFEPQTDPRDLYGETYFRFREACQLRGYLS